MVLESRGIPFLHKQVEGEINGLISYVCEFYLPQKNKNKLYIHIYIY